WQLGVRLDRRRAGVTASRASQRQRRRSQHDGGGRLTGLGDAGQQRRVGLDRHRAGGWRQQRLQLDRCGSGESNADEPVRLRNRRRPACPGHSERRLRRKRKLRIRFDGCRAARGRQQRLRLDRRLPGRGNRGGATASAAGVGASTNPSVGGSGNDASNSTGTAQVGGGNSATGSTGVVQSGGTGSGASGGTSAGGGSNATSGSGGTTQAGSGGGSAPFTP